MMAVVLIALCAAPHAPARQDNRHLQHVQRLAAPGRTWALEISLPDFSVKRNLSSADGRTRRLRAEREAEGCVVTVNLVPASTPKVSNKDLRDLAAERLKAGPAANAEGFKLTQYKQTPTLEYLVREFKGQLVNQKHFHAYLSRDGVWIDIHFSKTLFREGDEKLFHAILDTLRLTDSAVR